MTVALSTECLSIRAPRDEACEALDVYDLAWMYNSLSEQGGILLLYAMMMMMY
jgi:hypothetical protein